MMRLRSSGEVAASESIDLPHRSAIVVRFACPGACRPARPVPMEEEQRQVSPKATILIVDDEPDVRDVLEEYFVAHGYAAIGAESAGHSVLAHLTEKYRHSGEGVWRARIARGEVRIGSHLAGETDVLRPGQSLVWRRPPWEEAQVPLAFAILYRDAHLLAVAKPRGLPFYLPHFVPPRS